MAGGIRLYGEKNMKMKVYTNHKKNLLNQSNRLCSLDMYIML